MLGSLLHLYQSAMAKDLKRDEHETLKTKLGQCMLLFNYTTNGHISTANLAIITISIVLVHSLTNKHIIGIKH